MASFAEIKIEWQPISITNNEKVGIFDYNGRELKVVLELSANNHYYLIDCLRDGETFYFGEFPANGAIEFVKQKFYNEMKFIDREEFMIEL